MKWAYLKLQSGSSYLKLCVMSWEQIDRMMHTSAEVSHLRLTLLGEPQIEVYFILCFQIVIRQLGRLSYCCSNVVPCNQDSIVFLKIVIWSDSSHIRGTLSEYSMPKKAIAQYLLYHIICGALQQRATFFTLDDIYSTHTTCICVSLIKATAQQSKEVAP